MTPNQRPSRFVIALLGVVTTAWVVSPADVTVTGRVLEDGTSYPVGAAQVYVADLDIGVLSGADGGYTLRVPRERVRGDLIVTVQRIGYRQASVVIPSADLASETITRDVFLQQEALQLDEIVVTGAPSAVQRRAIGNTVTNVTLGTRYASATSAAVAPAGGGGFDREQYDHIVENAFRSVVDNPLSTFSTDVDRASYSNVRRWLLREGRIPPIDAVQIEEMINYFPYDYALPRGEHPLAITTELGRAPWNDGHRLLRIGLATRPVETESLPASNLVFLLDVSGSMQSWDKLPLVKRSLRLLVDQLRPQDRVAIVVYAGAAGLVLGSTPGSRKDVILDAIDRLEAGGSTAGGAGLRLAYHVARETFLEEGNNRVILATDGDFNVGESSDSEMIRLIEDERGHGVFLTVLGFGTGNLQSSKMQGIAQHGNGNYAYIDSIEEARKMLVGEMGGTILTVAQDVKIQVEFNPEHVGSYRLIGYENRLLAAEDFNDDRKDAGDIGAGIRVTALYEIIPAGSTTAPATVDPLRYQGARRTSDRAHADELALVRVRYKRPQADESQLLEQVVSTEVESPSNDFEFAAAVAGFGMLLRESEHRGATTVASVLALAEEGLGEDVDGYRRGFIDLVRAYQSLRERQER
jgi:Ca-activated chloride channel family protein